MTIATLKHNMIRKLGLKPSSLLSTFELFSYPKDNPSRKRDCKCTNILQTGALPTVRGEGQRLRKGFQDGGVLRVPRQIRSIKLTALHSPGYVSFSYPAHLESLSSAAELRHLAKNTRLRGKSFALLVLID